MKLFSLSIITIFILTISIHGVSAQSLGNCRISAMYKYCAVVVIAAQARAKDEEEKAAAKKIKNFFNETMGKYSKIKGNENVDTLIVKKAIKDGNANFNKTLGTCLGLDKNRLDQLTQEIDGQCRR